MLRVRMLLSTLNSGGLQQQIVALHPRLTCLLPRFRRSPFYWKQYASSERRVRGTVWTMNLRTVLDR